MWKEWIRNNLVNKHGNLQKARIRHFSFIRKHNIYLYDALKSIARSLRDNDRIETQSIWLYLNSLETPPICPICEKTTPSFDSFKKGYKKHCSSSCAANNIETREKFKTTCLERYGVDNVFKSDEIKDKIKSTSLEKYGVDHIPQAKEIKKKIRETNIEKFGCPCPLQNEEIKKKTRRTLNSRFGVDDPNRSPLIRSKIKETTFRKYGKEYYSQTEEWKNKFRNKRTDIDLKTKSTCLERYGFENQMKSAKVLEKSYMTKKENGTLNSSKEETIIFTRLRKKFIDVKRQYRSDAYPWACDFYIPSEDLYIEYQGSWTHGPEPFDENNVDHLKLLEHWSQKAEELNFKGQKKKYYLNAIETWTKRDAKKRKFMRDHDLNWIEFFTLEEFDKWFLE